MRDPRPPMMGRHIIGPSLGWWVASWASVAAQSAPRWVQEPPLGPFTTRGVYCEPSGAIVVLGGYTPQVQSWRWAGTWSQIRPPVAPPYRLDPAVAYDSIRGVAVWFGGRMVQSPNSATNETWEFDGSTWSLRTLPASPTPRWGAALGFDPVRQRTVSYGGTDPSQVFGDTWEYDGLAWVRRTPPVSPVPTSYMSMVWDANLQKLLMIGLAGIGSAETWTWDGVTWAQLVTPASPPLRANARLAHDPVRARTVLFGGNHPYVPAMPLFQDTWEFDGFTWTQRSPVTVPDGLLGYGMAWSPLLGGVVQVGGNYPGVARQSAAMHVFDGVDWNVAVPEAPFFRFRPKLAFDSARDRLVLQGGTDEFGVLQQETWEWGNGAWSRTAVGIGPTANLTYDPVRQCVVGVQGGITWEYRAIGWLPRNLSPTPANGPVWFDRHAQRVKCATTSQVWSFDGNLWVVEAQAGVGVTPNASAVHWSALDAAVVANGGAAVAVFGGSTWSGQSLPASPASGLAEDALHGALVGIDGVASATILSVGGGWLVEPAGQFEDPFDLALATDIVGGRVFGVNRGGAVSLLQWPAAGSLARLGLGCAGSFGVPRLEAFPGTTPLLGATVPMQLHALPFAPGLGVLALGDSIAFANGLPLPVPLDAVGLPGCRAWIPLQATAVFSHGGLQAQIAVAVPALPALAGVPFGLQVLVLDPLAANGFGAVTNALVLIAR